ncbi:MAG: hypothetical protein IT355_08430 [Gemmatimonadaceae bacterium]|nr:hypothetical protein [Gemmatimonadaceae bacterium]
MPSRTSTVLAGLCLLALPAASLPAQRPATATATMTIDSLLDPVEQYWRRRLAITFPSQDSLVVVCEHEGSASRGSVVRFITTEPWADEAVTDGSYVIFGMPKSGAGARLSARWGDNRSDEWIVMFLTPGRHAQRRAVIDEGAAFLQKLGATGAVWIRYRSGDWYRTAHLTVDARTQAALTAMRSRCFVDREGTGPAKH